MRILRRRPERQIVRGDRVAVPSIILKGRALVGDVLRVHPDGALDIEPRDVEWTITEWRGAVRIAKRGE